MPLTINSSVDYVVEWLLTKNLQGLAPIFLQQGLDAEALSYTSERELHELGSTNSETGRRS
jgi:hypothetical protein